MVLATPVLPPEASAHEKSGRLVAGGVGGVTGGFAMRGPEASLGPTPLGDSAAEGVTFGPQPATSTSRARASARRTGQWYGRCPLEYGFWARRGGGTGRRVGLKNRCPQGRAGSTPALGTTAG